MSDSCFEINNQSVELENIVNRIDSIQLDSSLSLPRPLGSPRPENGPGSPLPKPVQQTSILDLIYTKEQQENLTKDDLQLLKRFHEEVSDSPSSEKLPTSGKLLHFNIHILVGYLIELEKPQLF